MGDEELKFSGEQIKFSGKQVKFPGEQLSWKCEEIGVLMGHSSNPITYLLISCIGR